MGSFRFDDGWILRRLNSNFIHVRMRKNLSSVGPPNATTRKGPDNRRGEDATFGVLPS